MKYSLILSMFLGWFLFLQHSVFACATGPFSFYFSGGPGLIDRLKARPGSKNLDERSYFLGYVGNITRTLHPDAPITSEVLSAKKNQMWKEFPTDEAMKKIQALSNRYETSMADVHVIHQYTGKRLPQMFTVNANGGPCTGSLQALSYGLFAAKIDKNGKLYLARQKGF